MKQVALYIVLACYSLLMLKPVTPYISDAIAHVFFYAQHMATVHYQDGKFHVHREVIDIAKKTASDKETNALKKNNTVTDHILVQQRENEQLPDLKNIFEFSALEKLACNHLAGDYPPPRS